MFFVFRIPNKPIVSLAVTRDGEFFVLVDSKTGISLPMTQNMGSLIADCLGDMNVGDSMKCLFSVGSEMQDIWIVRTTSSVDGFYIEDESGAVYDFDESPLDLILSTAQMESLTNWWNIERRRRA